MIFENLPQLIIQIMYGVHTGQANYRAIAWYITIFTSSFHAAVQILDIIDLVRKLPELEEVAKKEAANAQVVPAE